MYGPSTRRGFKSAVYIDYKGKERRISKTKRGFETLERRVARESEKLDKQTLTSFFGRKSSTIRNRFLINQEVKRIIMTNHPVITIEKMIAGYTEVKVYYCLENKIIGKAIAIVVKNAIKSR
ncbi:hypothetical protein T492DRAFT_833464 [Pavlovales sp. CCMP2436]|nr:hypothetical protein T492DRAFT_833464 [Pavlovales sp. CCMP2436]